MPEDKELIVVHGEIQTPPMSSEARTESGYLIRQLQQGLLLSMPQSRPMPIIGHNCHELRITDSDKIWRIIYYIDVDAIVVFDVFNKTMQVTPKQVIEACQRRLTRYLAAAAP